MLPTSLAGSERDKREFSVSAGELSVLGSARSPHTRGKRSPDCALPAPKLLLAPGPQCSQLENGGKTTKNEQREGWGSGGRQEVVLKEQQDRDAGHHGAEDEGIIPHGRSVPSVEIHLGCFL